MTRTFLTAEWRYLAMLNFNVDPGVLRPNLPKGVELDTHGGRHEADNDRVLNGRH